MSKAIKVEDQVYQELDLLRAKRATFSDVVEGLLKLRLKTMELMNALEGQLRYGEWQREKTKETPAVITRGDRQEVSHL